MQGRVAGRPWVPVTSAAARCRFAGRPNAHTQDAGGQAQGDGSASEYRPYEHTAATGAEDGPSPSTSPLDAAAGAVDGAEAAAVSETVAAVTVVAPTRQTEDATDSLEDDERQQTLLQQVQSLGRYVTTDRVGQGLGLGLAGLLAASFGVALWRVWQV